MGIVEAGAVLDPSVHLHRVKDEEGRLFLGGSSLLTCVEAALL